MVVSKEKKRSLTSNWTENASVQTIKGSFQRVLGGRTLLTPALYPVHYCIKPFFQRVNKTQKFK